MASTEIEPILIEQPQPIRNQVYLHLRDQILNRTIEPSSRLVEAQIAKKIGTSRTPVREALHLLAPQRILIATLACVRDCPRLTG